MAKRNRRKVTQPQQRLYYLMGFVTIAVIAVGIAYTLLNAPPDVADARLEFEAKLGSADAPIQLIEYGAYGCHSCRAVHQGGYVQQVMETYGDRVEFIFRNFPNIHPNDPLSAQAAQCALDQGEAAFWNFHNSLFNLSDAAYNDYSSKDNYIDFAESIGLDSTEMKTCMNEKRHQKTVDYWDDDGQRVGVAGTPTFFLNGQRINPSQLLAAVESVLE